LYVFLCPFYFPSAASEILAVFLRSHFNRRERFECGVL
jgi:hypothetical protein